MTMANVGTSRTISKVAKFRMGENVKCIVVNNQHERKYSSQGHGWDEGLEFKINKITKDTVKNAFIYWPGRFSCGVFEDYIERAD